MLPTSKTRPGMTRRAPAHAAPAGPSQKPAAADSCEGKVHGPQMQGPQMQGPQLHGPADPLGPIGPDRLRALREALRNGTYPTEADVLGGIERLLGE